MALRLFAMEQQALPAAEFFMTALILITRSGDRIHMWY
jgi:hypothetical protein